MRFLTWFLIAALLVAWPELAAALAQTAVWAVQQPAVLIGGLIVIGARHLLARGWV